MQRSKLLEHALQARPVPTRESLDTTYAQVVKLRRKIVEAQSALKQKSSNNSFEKDIPNKSETLLARSTRHQPPELPKLLREA